MSTKTLLRLCAQVFLLKTITAYCIDTTWPTSTSAVEGTGWTAQGYTCDASLMVASPYAAPASFLASYDLAALPSSYGGAFTISSASPVASYGVSVISDNGIEGILAIGGELPFLGTIGLEGTLPTAGAGTISYGCGDGNVGMVSESVLPITSTNGFSWPTAGLSYGSTANNNGYTAAWIVPGAEYGYAY